MKKLLDPKPLLVPEPAPFWLAPVNWAEISRLAEAEEVHRNYTID